MDKVIGLTETERLEEFLKKLTNLTKKYNIEIGGCECENCLNPYLYDRLNNKYIKAQHLDSRLEWYEEEKQYIY